MILYALIAFTGGALVSLSRQLNGRLSLSTSPLHSSFWNHFIGFVFISAIALAVGGMFATEGPPPPWFAYLGGPLGAVFITASSWLVTRIGAAHTAMLIIAGQMISGVVLDVILDAPGNPIARIAGVTLILAGMWLTQRPKGAATVKS